MCKWESVSSELEMNYLMISTLIYPWALKRWVTHQKYTKFNTNPMTTNKNTTDTCDSLLRGELSAIETYTQAIGKFGPSVESGSLKRIQSSHMAHAELLRALMKECGEEPAISSGPWGTFATTVEGVATILGESAALIALKQGEEHGIRQYEKALVDKELCQSVKNLIRDTFLPAQREHLIQLEKCMASLV